MNYRTVIAIALSIPFVSMAQGDIVASTLEHEGALQPALMVDMNIPKDDAKDHYQDFMKDRYDVRVKGLGFLRNKDLVSVEQVTLPSLHAQAMDLYAFFEDHDKDGVRMKLIGRDGYDLHFGPDHAPEAQQHLRDLLNNYKVYALEAYYTELLSEQNDEKEDLVRDQEHATEDISDNKEQIEENLKDNKKRQKKIEDLQEEKEERARRLEELKKEIARSKAALPVSK